MYLKDCLQNDVKCNQLVHKFPLCHQKTSGGVLWCLAVGHWHFWVSWVRGLGLRWLIDWTCSRMSGHSFADFVLWMSTLYCGGGPANQECRCCEVIYLVCNGVWLGGACQGHPPECQDRRLPSRTYYFNEMMKLFTLSVSVFIVMAHRCI